MSGKTRLKEWVVVSHKCFHCGQDLASPSAKIDHDASRNITKEELLARIIWGAKYASSRQSARCFFRSLSDGDKRIVRESLAAIAEAA